MRISHNVKPFRQWLAANLATLRGADGIKRRFGRAFGVFDPKRAGSPKKAWEGLLAPKRVTSMNAPKYRKTDELGALLRASVTSLCLDLDAQTRAVRR